MRIQKKPCKVTLLKCTKTAMILLFLIVFTASVNAQKENFCKEVLILHHSHLDVGYTHLQPIVWEFQKDFINQALKMLDETVDWPEQSRPKWTCEVTAPVIRWLQTANSVDVERFAKYVKQGRIGISALEYNTTPLASAEGLARQLYPAREIRERFNVKINTANLHDATGLPWTITDLLIDSDVEMLIMAINLHLSGTPLPRPAVYRWRSPGGRELLVMNGEHYSMFDQWLDTWKNDLDAMSQGMEKYLRNLESLKYPYDFVYLSATCAPYAYDNSPPNVDLPKLVRQWNEQGRKPGMRFVTPQDLLERIKKIPRESIPVVKGDWTDYWNFGAASSALETKISLNTAADLAAIDFLHAFGKPDEHLKSVTRQIWQDVNLFTEHTWGAYNTLDANSFFVTAQWNMKAHPAYEGQALSQYVLVKQLQRLAGNPESAWARQGVLIVNPSGSAVRYNVPIPEDWRKNEKQLEIKYMGGFGFKRHFPANTQFYGPVDLAPFSWQIIPFTHLTPVASSDVLQTGKDFIESPYYRLTYDPERGRITSLFDKQRNWEVLDQKSPWGFFQFVHEKPDPRSDSTRKAFHVRSVENERIGLTGWKPDWKAVYSGITGNVACRVERTALGSTLIIYSQAERVKDLEQRITLRADSPLISLDVSFRKQDVWSPESIYFTFPLNLPEDWRSYFDTGDIPIELDAEQIPGVCKDWVTVNSFVSVHNGDRGVTLYCPDAPLVQVGDFNFGRKHAVIERRKNPLLLAWPLNNYWETNFRGSQPGFMEFSYFFSSDGDYDPLTVTQEAQHVMNPPIVHPVINCNEPLQGKFLQLKGTGIKVVYSKAAENNQGIIVRLLNLKSEPVQGELTFPGRTISSAWLCSAQEENRESLDVRDSVVSINLSPRLLTTIRIQ